MSTENEKLLDPPTTLEDGILPHPTTYPKTPLKLIRSRPSERRPVQLYFFGLIIMLLGSFSTSAASEYQYGFYITSGVLLSGMAMMFYGVYGMIRAAKKMKCKGCGKQMVKTPYCPWCGEYDPLGDYEEWTLRDSMMPEKKGIQKLRPWFL